MKKQRTTVAVTGGIGSGKTAVMRLIEEKKYPVFSCDEIYREISESEEYLLKIKAMFPSVITEKGGLDRRKLSQIVFNDKAALNRLNAAAHPLILSELKRRIEEQSGLVFCEVPLLFEGGLEGEFDYVIIVKRPIQDRVLAVCERDKISREDALKRIANQFDYQKLTLLPENFFVLDNSGTKTQLAEGLEQIIKKLL